MFDCKYELIFVQNVDGLFDPILFRQQFVDFLFSSGLSGSFEKFFKEKIFRPRSTPSGAGRSESGFVRCDGTRRSSREQNNEEN